MMEQKRDTAHEHHPRDDELVWHDEHGHPHIADLAEERAIQAQRARARERNAPPISTVRSSPD
ncbi:hypothetical protein [Pelagibacterium luteolum]|uniref:Uncharacterized protein n=1 Tax=Pelagibacterium luteolum TaxID=440168 RepID=A0A1G8A4N8_9HYPH|nr:hypothetical protein [Pelagibacterium luteolum]SDH15843.1 hypothetical protein SAMN04487974_1261 [Pelagibacterium luteolum]